MDWFTNRPRKFYSLRSGHSTLVAGSADATRFPRRLHSSADFRHPLCRVPPAAPGSEPAGSSSEPRNDASWRYCSKILVGSATQRRSSTTSQWATLHSVARLIVDFSCSFDEIDPTLLFPYSDACKLLQKLEEIFIEAEQGSGNDYLSVFMRVIKIGPEIEALNRLITVRLALARYFARCTVIGVGGKNITERRSYAVA